MEHTFKMEVISLDKDEIKKALDHFENDEFTDAKEILQKQIRQAKNDFIDDKLGLSKEEEKAEADGPEVVDSDGDD